MKYSVSLPLPKGWQQNGEEFTEEGISLFQLSSELDKGEEGLTHIDIIAGAMPEDLTIEESARNSFEEFMEENSINGEDNSLTCYKFKGNDAWGYQMELDGFTFRNLFTEILPGVLCMISCYDSNSENIDSVMALIEKKIAVKISF